MPLFQLGKFGIDKRWPACVAIATLSVCATLALAQNAFFQLVRLKAEDLHFQWRGRVPTRNIVILAIDRKSLDSFPEPRLFWHKYYAEAAEAAARGGAKVVGLDVTFVIPVSKWEREADQAMAQAVLESAQTAPIVCAYVPSATFMQKDWPVPVNVASSFLGLSGFVNLTVDRDDFVRDQELFENRPGSSEPIARSFALRVAEKYIGQDAAIAGNTISLAGGPIPLAADRRLRINFAGPAGTFPRVAFSDFITASRNGDNAKIRSWVRGKVVLIGSDYIDDRYPTPFFPLLGGGNWNTPGVEIFASTIQTLLDKTFVVPAPRWLAITVISGMALLAAICTLFLPAGRALILLLGLLAAGLGVSQWTFIHGVSLPTLEIPTTAAFSFLGAGVYRFFSAEKRGDLFRQAMLSFVGKGAVHNIESKESLSTSGTRDIVTILFSDIRGFTSFCDDLEPDEVVRLLNEYFTLMVGIIASHYGQVNKFIGDGILAIFSESDKVGLSDREQLSGHALRAVRCATAMLEAPCRFKTGIAIHTGPVVIGNIGSAEKLEFTALGQTVNIASRLETLNKEYGTRLLISEATQDQLEGTVETELIESVEVRGVGKRVPVYTLASQPRVLLSAGTRD